MGLTGVVKIEVTPILFVNGKESIGKIPLKYTVSELGSGEEIIVPTPSIPMTGLIAWWKFDELSYSGTIGEVKDSSGGHNGTSLNGAQVINDPARGKVASFDGIDDVINISDSSNLRFGTNNFTLSVWINLTGGTGLRMILDKSSGPSSGGWALYYPSNNIQFVAQGDHAGNNFGCPLIDGTWANYVVVRSGVDITIYKDGVFCATDSSYTHQGAVVDYILNTPLTIGGFMGASNVIQGAMDDVLIYNRTLSSTEVSSLCQVQNGNVAC